MHVCRKTISGTTLGVPAADDALTGESFVSKAAQEEPPNNQNRIKRRIHTPCVCEIGSPSDLMIQRRRSGRCMPQMSIHAAKRSAQDTTPGKHVGRLDPYAHSSLNMAFKAHCCPVDAEDMHAKCWQHSSTAAREKQSRHISIGMCDEHAWIAPHVACKALHMQSTFFADPGVD